LQTILAAVVAALFLAAATSRAAEKPNFLFVMVDDMAPDAIFHKRFDFVKTPNLQRLADEGAEFENMMVTTSLCSPIRASILTGTYSHMHSVRYNEIQDPKELRNLINAPEAAEQLAQMQELLKQVKEQSGYTEPPYKYEPPRKIE
jgi:hypothetical protein